MRSKRIYGSEDSAVYHCVSRTVNGEYFFGDGEKEVMRKMLRRVADFSGVELLSYVVMSNHVHVLVRVRMAARAIDDVELLRRFKVLYPKKTQYLTLDPEVLKDSLERNTPEGQSWRKRLTSRMGHVSEFMKTLKQRFSLWFNKKHERFGPVWSDRFKSTLVEDSVEALRVVAAYIDLNPVRSGMVGDPKDYRFCSYAEALAGDAVMRAGICSCTGEGDVRQALAMYRSILFARGAETKRDGSGAIVSDEAFESVMKSGGELPWAVVLRQRVRYFSEGAVIGSKQFVETHIEKWSTAIGDKVQRLPKQPSEPKLSEFSVFRRVSSVR